MDVFSQALAWIAAGRPCALATVVSASGSTPRRPGARMLVSADGSQTGTIGGGRIELEAAKHAAKIATTGQPGLFTFHLTRDLAMCCGGTMEVFIAPAAPSRASVERIASAGRAREPILVETSLATGAMQVLALPEGFGKQPLREGDRFREPLWPADRALIFGAGHVGCATGKALCELGFEVVLCDDNETGAIDEQPPWAARVVASFALADVSRAIGDIGAGDHAIVTTRDHDIDQQILEDLCLHHQQRPLPYVGVIGSRRKIARFRQRIEAKNLALPKSFHGPIGLDIGADTPQEIAIAIAAELVALRARGGSDAKLEGARWSRR